MNKIDEIKARLRRGEYYMPHAPDDIAYLLGEIEGLTAESRAHQEECQRRGKLLNEVNVELAVMTADRDAYKRRAEAAEKLLEKYQRMVADFTTNA